MDESNRYAEEAKKAFDVCSDVFIALGDKVRQTIVLAVAESVEGMDVKSITKKTHLSRPAVSHHIKILKNAGVIEDAEVGTHNFYRLTVDRRLSDCRNLLNSLEKLVENTDERK